MQFFFFSNEQVEVKSFTLKGRVHNSPSLSRPTLSFKFKDWPGVLPNVIIIHQSNPEMVTWAIFGYFTRWVATSYSSSSSCVKFWQSLDHPYDKAQLHIIVTDKLSYNLSVCYLCIYIYIKVFFHQLLNIFMLKKLQRAPLHYDTYLSLLVLGGCLIF